MMNLKFNLSLGLLLLAGMAASAQKLVNVQEAPVRAPEKVKVDGKLTEWNDTFQAYNKTTQLIYTVSNDDNFLYLAFRVDDAQASRKVTAGGITLTINTANKKKEQDAFKLIFPLIDRQAMFSAFQNRSGGGGGGAPVMGFAGPPQGVRMGTNGPIFDSATLATMHKATINAAKEIKLFGFKDIADSVISVYNEYNIKAALGYDAKGSLTCEMAVPLKSLGLSAENPKEFTYNIKVNGMQMMVMRRDDGGMGGPPGGGDRAVTVVAVGGGGGGGRMQGDGGGGFGGGMGGPPGGGMGGPPPGIQNMMSPTDFWGKYTLAKK